MNKNMLDHIHRGYLTYRDMTEDASVERTRRAFVSGESGSERCDTALLTCEVNTDWIERIEAALPYLDRAVRENRQFILRVGETVPIEKVRRVSKTTVEHLARHSEYITKEPEEGEEVTPEKLLMTENVGTYAVYENRFLYMLLCYVHDFVEIKQQRITECANSFSSEIEFARSIRTKKRKVEFSISYREKSTEDIPTELSSATQSALVRIRNILAEVDTLLKTGLMIEVSAAPMLKPPIARTNVLMQNPAFSAAMELYDYLCAYTGPGYEQKDLTRNTGEVTDAIRGDFAEIALLSSYLAYRHGGLEDELDRRLALTLSEEEEARVAARDRHIAELRQQLGEVDGRTLEYLMQLESRLAEDSAELNSLRAERGMYTAAISDMKRLQEELDAAIAAREQAEGEVRHLGDIIRINEDNSRKAIERTQLLVMQKDDEMRKAVERAGIEAERRIDAVKAQYAELLESYNLISARLHAREGGSSTDYTTRAGFAALEAEHKAYQRFFDSEWKKAKAAIRRDRLWKKQPSRAAGADVPPVNTPKGNGE